MYIIDNSICLTMIISLIRDIYSLQWFLDSAEGNKNDISRKIAQNMIK